MSERGEEGMDRSEDSRESGSGAETEGRREPGGRERDSGPTERISEGLRQGLGVLSAFKEALEETIEDARERGELSSDRARELVRDAVGRAREAAGGAREKLDFAHRDEVEKLRDQLEELRVRLENLEQRTSQAPGAGPSRPAGGEGST